MSQTTKNISEMMQMFLNLSVNLAVRILLEAYNREFQENSEFLKKGLGEIKTRILRYGVSREEAEEFIDVIEEIFSWVENNRLNDRVVILAVRQAFINFFSQSIDGTEKKKPLEGVTMRASDLMTGFQAATARSIRAETTEGEENENIKEYFIKNLEVELAVPIVGTGSGEPLLMLPSVGNVTEESPFVKMKFGVAYIPKDEEEE